MKLEISVNNVEQLENNEKIQAVEEERQVNKKLLRWRKTSDVNNIDDDLVWVELWIVKELNWYSQALRDVISLARYYNAVNVSGQLMPPFRRANRCQHRLPLFLFFLIQRLSAQHCARSISLINTQFNWSCGALHSAGGFPFLLEFGRILTGAVWTLFYRLVCPTQGHPLL